MELSSRAIARRAKKFLRSNELELFVPVLPGLEQVALREVTSRGHGAVRVAGGISFNGNLPTVYETNLLHRTGNRVLIRISKFLAQSYPMLYDHTKRLPWEALLGNCLGVEVKTSFAKSRLRNRSHIASVVEDAIVARCQPLGLSPLFTGPAHVSVHVRLHEDQCTISLDSTGAHLHKRGYRVDGVVAPIRESTAAGILMLALAAEHDVIVDPFCGSGTMCIEAEMQVRNMAPGLRRSFAIEQTPLHSAGTLAQARREAVDLERRPAGVRIVGSDLDQRAVELATMGSARAGCSIAHFHEMNAIELRLQDLKSSTESGLIVSNLPFGKRISTPDEVEHLLAAFRDQLVANGSGWNIAFVTRHPEVFNDAGPIVHKKLDFLNGGLRVTAIFGRIP